MDKQYYTNQRCITDLHTTKAQADVNTGQYYPPKTEVIELTSDSIMAKGSRLGESNCGLLAS